MDLPSFQSIEMIHFRIPEVNCQAENTLRLSVCHRYNFEFPHPKRFFFIEIDGYLSKPVDIFDNITSYIVIVRRPQIFQFRQKSARSFRTFE